MPTARRAALLLDGVYIQELNDLLEEEEKQNMPRENSLASGDRRGDSKQRTCSVVSIQALTEMLECEFGVQFSIKWAAIPVSTGGDSYGMDSVRSRVTHPCLTEADSNIRALRDSGFVVQPVPIRETWPRCPNRHCSFASHPIRVLCPELSCENHARDRPLDVYYRTGLDAHVCTKMLQLGLRNQHINTFVLVLREGEYEDALRSLTMEENKEIFFAIYAPHEQGDARLHLADHLRPYASPHTLKKGPGILNLYHNSKDLKRSVVRRRECSREEIPKKSTTASKILEPGQAHSERSVAWQQVMEDLMNQNAEALTLASTRESNVEPRDMSAQLGTVPTPSNPNIPSERPTLPNMNNVTLQTGDRTPELSNISITKNALNNKVVVAEHQDGIEGVKCDTHKTVSAHSVYVDGTGPLQAVPKDSTEGAPTRSIDQAGTRIHYSTPEPQSAETRAHPSDATSVTRPVKPQVAIRRVQTNLPPGYTMHFHTESRKYYYVCGKDNSTSWVHPYGAAAQADVDRQVMESLAALAALQAQTSGSTVQRNAPVPCHLTSNTVQEYLPAPSAGAQPQMVNGAPSTSDDWIEAKDPTTQAVYYFNQKTRQTSWARP